MIGKVVFPYKSITAEAVMDDDGLWRCDAIPCLARPLNLLHSPQGAGSPVDWPHSLRCLESAAVWLHGQVRTDRLNRARRQVRRLTPPSTHLAAHSTFTTRLFFEGFLDDLAQHALNPP